MKFEKLGKLVKNLDNKRIPLNSLERNQKSENGKYPYIGANNIVGYINEYIFDEKILCIAEDGGSWGLNETCANIYNEKCWVNNHAHVLIENGKANLEYLRYFLNYENLNKYITGTTRGKLTKTALENIQISIPEKLKDQIRISTILSKAENLIKQRKKSIDLLDDFIKSAFLKMFGDPLRNERGWEIERLDKIAKLERGRFSPRPRNDPSYFDGDYPFIQTGDISRSGNRLSKFTQTLNEKGIRVSKKFNKGTIVIAIVGATIGATAILEIDTYATDSIIGIIPKTEFVNTYFLEFTMQFWKPILLANAPEAARPNINLEILNKLGISNPPIELQNQFAQIVEKTETLKAQYQQSLQELEGLFGSLSQKAFKGELDLSKFKIKIGEDLGMEESEILIAAEPEVEYLKSKG